MFVNGFAKDMPRTHGYSKRGDCCFGTHDWARQLTERGFTVKLIAAQFVKPYVKSNKNDRSVHDKKPFINSSA